MQTHTSPHPSKRKYTIFPKKHWKYVLQKWCFALVCWRLCIIKRAHTHIPIKIKRNPNQTGQLLYTQTLRIPVYNNWVSSGKYRNIVICLTIWILFVFGNPPPTHPRPKTKFCHPYSLYGEVHLERNDAKFLELLWMVNIKYLSQKLYLGSPQSNSINPRGAPAFQYTAGKYATI